MSFLLAEQNTNVALRYADYGYILENGRVVMDGDAAATSRQRGREGVLPRPLRRRPQELPRREALPPPQALARLKASDSPMTSAFYDGSRPAIPKLRERALLAALPQQIAHAKRAARRLFRRASCGESMPRAITTPRGARGAAGHAQVASCCELQKADAALRRPRRDGAGRARARLHVAGADLRARRRAAGLLAASARALFAAGFRAGDLVHNCFSYHFTPAGSMLETGAHALGCTVFPGGIGQTELQVRGDRAICSPTAMSARRRSCASSSRRPRAAAPISRSLKKALVSGEAFPPALQKRGRASAASRRCNATARADLGIDRLREPRRARG